jgi:hypothetical protein
LFTHHGGRDAVRVVQCRPHGSCVVEGIVRERVAQRGEVGRPVDGEVLLAEDGATEPDDGEPLASVEAVETAVGRTVAPLSPANVSRSAVMRSPRMEPEKSSAKMTRSGWRSDGSV